MYTKGKDSLESTNPLIITDPKGIAFSEFGKMLRKDGYKIKVINILDTHASFNPSERWEKYINFARNEKSPYQIVYGGVIHGNIDSGEIESYYESNKGCAFIDPNSIFNDDISVSYCDAIRLYNNYNKGLWMPFAALMRTHHILDNAEYPVTMIPYTKKMRGTCMFNTILLMACRTVAVDGLDLRNWDQYIDEELLIQTFSVADLFIPNENKPQDQGRDV